MKRTLLTLIILILGSSIYAQDNSDRILGVWLNNLKNAKVEIFEKEGQFFGKIVWIDIKKDVDINKATDKNNPDPSLRNRNILGLEILTDLVYENGTWTDGKLYSPEKGKTVDCELEISEDNQTLFLTASKGWFSKTLEWKRVDNKQDGKNEN